MKSRLFGTRKRIVVTAIIAALVLASSAYAAFSVFSGTSGSVNGSFSSQTVQNAISLSSGTFANTVSPGQTSNITANLVDNDASATSHDVTSQTGTFTVAGAVLPATNAVCAGDLTYTPNDLTSFVLSGGGTLTGKTIGSVTVAAGTPNGCASATITLNITGATT